MSKVAEFSKVLDLLKNDEKGKLLLSAKRLMEAQKLIRVTVEETSLSRKRKSAERTKNH